MGKQQQAKNVQQGKASHMELSASVAGVSVAHPCLFYSRGPNVCTCALAKSVSSVCTVLGCVCRVTSINQVEKQGGDEDGLIFQEAVRNDG